MIDNIERGDVYYVSKPVNIGSHITGGDRPYVIVGINVSTQVVTACPMTTNLDKHPWTAYVNVNQPGKVLCDQITTLDISELGDLFGTISEEEMIGVDTKISQYLGLKGNSELTAIKRELKNTKEMLSETHDMLQYLVWKYKK